MLMEMDSVSLAGVRTRAALRVDDQVVLPMCMHWRACTAPDSHSTRRRLSW